MVAVGGGWRGGMGGGFGNRGFRIGEWVADSGIGDSGIGELAARESGCGETGNPGIADFRNSRNSGSGNGFGIDGCAQLCARGAEFGGIRPWKPGIRHPETPELANNYGIRPLAGSLAPEL